MSFRRIKLTQGKHTIIDSEDYERVMKRKWCYMKNARGYGRAVSRNPETKKNDYLHRFILNLERYDGNFVDHKNLNPLDNRKCNVRVTTTAGNQRNQRKRKGKYSSKYKGVWFHKTTKKWRSEIKFNYKKIYIGTFSNEKEAGRAYNKKAIELHNEFAHLNKI